MSNESDETKMHPNNVIQKSFLQTLNKHQWRSDQ